MNLRIDHVEIKLEVYDEFEGHRDVMVAFTPADQDAALVELIRQKWREQYLADLEAVKKGGAGDFFTG